MSRKSSSHGKSHYGDSPIQFKKEPMLLDPDLSQLVLVDYQARLMPKIFEHEEILRNAELLGIVARGLEIPVWGTEQNPQGLGQNVEAIRQLCLETMSKRHFSAVAEGLTARLRPEVEEAPPGRQGGNARSLPKHLQNRAPQPAAETERNMIVIAGCEAHVCLLQTALDLIDEEFEVWVVTDACSSRTERNRDAAFDRLATAGADLVTTEMVVFEWMRTSEHIAFRDILPLIK
jgi:nicotinamidase-related amidase